MILSAENLGHSYGVRTLFKNISFNIEEGDKIGVIGGQKYAASRNSHRRTKRRKDYQKRHLRN